MINFDLGNFPSEFLAFFKQRLIRHWRSLVTLLIGIFIPLVIFGELAIATRQNLEAFTWDKSLLLNIHLTASPDLDRFASVFTHLGVFWGVFPIALGVSLVLFNQRRWRSLVYLITAILGSWLICHTAKILLHRERPHLWEAVRSPLDYSFPSGHAMSSMTLAAALVILTWGSRWHLWTLLLGMGYVLVIGWTRLYLGVHFPSDVLAGWLASIAWTVGVSLLINPYSAERYKESTSLKQLE
jgi:membrane-associated phospholipid phosphatase